MISTQTIKVLLDFFQKIAKSRGRASGRPAHGAKYPPVATGETPAPRTARNSRPPQRAKSPIVQSAIRRWRNPRPKAMAPAATPCGGGRWGPSFPLGVGAGIPDGPGWNAPWTRQECRVPRNGYTFAPVRRSTLPGTARRHTQVPPYERGRTAPLRWGRVRYQTRYDIRPPSTTRDGVGTAAFGFAGGSAICGWRFRTLRVFHAVRGAGISPAAAGDQRLCLWKPRFGQRAAGWQEVSARNFVSEQGPVSPPYWMYGKKLGRSYGAKGPATPADTPAVSCPTEKNRVKLLSLFLLMGFAAAPESAAYTAKTPETN